MISNQFSDAGIVLLSKPEKRASTQALVDVLARYPHAELATETKVSF